jgi:hypothetical protein
MEGLRYTWYLELAKARDMHHMHLSLSPQPPANKEGSSTERLPSTHQHTAP